jgi:hypothetical protein
MSLLAAPQARSAFGGDLAGSLAVTASDEGGSSPDEPADSRSPLAHAALGDKHTAADEQPPIRHERDATLTRLRHDEPHDDEPGAPCPSPSPSPSPALQQRQLAQQQYQSSGQHAAPRPIVGSRSHPELRIANGGTKLGWGLSSSPETRLSGPSFQNGNNGAYELPHLVVPPSPSCSIASSMGGSQSDYEPLDSPSSMSSWNSFVAPGVRRGDLADVEDLDLDGASVHEPELETVSECDEESSSFASGSDRPGFGDSDADEIPGTPHQHHYGHGLGLGGSIRKMQQQTQQQQQQHLAPTQTASAPQLPHFSPRAGGHGLSSMSRHGMRAPAGLAARRRKGRIAELAEEGAAGEVTSTTPPAKPLAGATVMPSPDSTPIAKERTGDMSTPGVLSGRRRSSRGSASAREAAIAAQNAASGVSARPEDLSPTTPTPFTTSTSWNEFEFVGPPPLPPRCVSPSETVPAVPSPLCECVSAPVDEPSTGIDQSVETLRDVSPHAPSTASPLSTSDTVAPGAETPPASADTAAPPSPTSSRPSSESIPSVAASSPPTTPEAPPLVRKSSRGRRSSSPTRPKPKVPLRPCFRRRTSAQSAQGLVRPPSGASWSSARDSSSESESIASNTSRGRARVRFSQAPPQELRTHSPVEYDRKACAVSNRLSAEDVEEMRDMHMEMGLLEAKWAAMAACKSGSSTASCSEDEGGPSRDVKPTRALLSTPTNPDPHHLIVPGPSFGERKRADSIASSSPSTFCKNRFGGDGSLSAPSTPSGLSPAEHLRQERARERALRYAGIGTGAGFRFNWNAGAPGAPAGRTPRPELGQCQRPAGTGAGVNPLIARFGLSKPPPPLPGTTPNSSANNSPSPPPGPHEPLYGEGSSSRRDFSTGSDASTRTLMGARSASISPERARFAPGTGYDRRESPSAPIMSSYGGPSFLSLPSGPDADHTPRGRRGTSPAPALTHTSPSPSPPPTMKSSVSTAASTYSDRPSSLASGRSTPATAPSTPCGYDSPASCSEFYESGSEWDFAA